MGEDAAPGHRDAACGRSADAPQPPRSPRQPTRSADAPQPPRSPRQPTRSADAPQPPRCGRTRRLTPLGLLISVALVVGCSRSPQAPEPPPASVLPDTSRAEPAAPPELPAAPPELPAELPPPEAPAAPTGPGPELCASACANTLALILADLPESTSARMRDELSASMDTDCRQRCLDQATPASALCLARARSLLESAECTH